MPVAPPGLYSLITLQAKGIYRSRVAALLLIFVFLVATACGNQASTDSGNPKGQTQASKTSAATTLASTTKSSPKTAKESASGGGEKTVKAVKPGDILSKKERTGIPKFSKWNDKGGDVPKIANTSDSSVGAIPAVKPFNFGRDPGGPGDKTLYLTVPRLGITDAPVFDSATEEKLKESVIHVPATGFPWQQDANTYIAGHRIGYEGTGSWHIFYNLDQVVPGDKIILKDANGGEYDYNVTKQVVVPPDNVQIMEPVPGKSLISLQTCTLPDYSKRIIVQGELVNKKT